jgi:quinoprotein glucose dehydrogenase
MSVRLTIVSAIMASLAVMWLIPILAGENEPLAPDTPKVADASDEGEKAIPGFRVPKDLKASLFAAEPSLANPVCFYPDDRGRVFVCETYRQKKGIEDNRDHGEWLDDDLAAQTVEDRLAYIKKHAKDKIGDYTKYDDRVRLVEDTDDDGKADRHSVFADRFNSIVEGTGAGVLVQGNDVFYTNIPHLWRLRDNDGDGVAEERTPLSSGYGVRFAFHGHDMHGLRLGMDGRVYFSIGDRGLNVKTPTAHFVNPESGAILRCELDGSNLEIVATGLRNPQELAFNEYGDLFTGDNNSDSGDQARWVHVVEGSDTGWRMYYQYLNDRGPFNREKIWHLYHREQPAYIVPPLKHIASGPSGLAYYPGTGLPEHYQGRFFLCDFRGQTNGSGVRSFKVKPNGATFELVDSEETLWNILATDVDFAPDGSIYVSDWVTGWNGQGKGRIYKFASTDANVLAQGERTKKLLKEGFVHRPVEELSNLVGYPDQRVRLQSQLALVEQKQVRALSALAQTSAKRIERIHGIWGLAMLARRQQLPEATWQVFASLADDDDPEIRAQAIKAAGDVRFQGITKVAIARLKDDSSRVRFYAAEALSKIKAGSAVDAVVEAIVANDDADPVLRHALVLALAQGASPEKVASLQQNDSVALRRAAVVALRRQKSSLVSKFLSDRDPLVSTEAARAIYDLPLSSEYPALASHLMQVLDNDAFARRALAAHYRLGGKASAQAIAEVAALNHAPDHLRRVAVDMLANWEKPSGRDNVLCDWRPIEERDLAPAKSAFEKHFVAMMAGSNDLRSDVVQAAVKLGIKEIGPTLREIVAANNRPGRERADALAALAYLKDEQATELIRTSRESTDPTLRAGALDLWSQASPDEAISALIAAVTAKEQVERQAAAKSLGESKAKGADDAVACAIELIVKGELPQDTWLDVIEAAAKRNNDVVKQALNTIQTVRPKESVLADYVETLAGGDAAVGKRIFFERAAVYCVRCHKVGETGGDVGPNLSKIATDKTREYLLEAIVTPSKAIAKGFESVQIADEDGKLYTGIVRAEDEEKITLIQADGKMLVIPKSTIEERTPTRSAMPEEFIKHLTKRDLRDLVEYLSTLK